MKLVTPFSFPKAGMTALPKRDNKAESKNHTKNITTISSGTLILYSEKVG